MARVEAMGFGETRRCAYCDNPMARAMGDTQYVMVRGITGKEEPWHVGCAEDIGIIVEPDADEHDPYFDYDPDYDGAKEDDDE